MSKSLTIAAVDAGNPPVIKAADPDKDVLKVQGKSVNIANLTLTGAGNASGVHLDHTSGCVVTSITARDNLRAIYLDGATNNQVLNSNLAGNGYGVYSDGSPNNTISGNAATGEQGEGSHALGDGVYLYYSPGATITNNNCSLNHVFGISLYNSPNTTIAHNQIRTNEQIGVRLRDSDSCTLTYNTFSGNGQPGKLLDFPPAAPSFGQVGILVGSNNTHVYLNNFINQSTPVSGDQAVLWDSSQKLTYTYNNAKQTRYLGNYYSDYTGSDANGTGMGSPPASTGDLYPLMQAFEHYLDNRDNGVSTASVQQSPNIVGGNTMNLTNSVAQSFVLGFGAGAAILTLASVVLILALSRVRRRSE